MGQIVKSYLSNKPAIVLEIKDRREPDSNGRKGIIIGYIYTLENIDGERETANDWEVGELSKGQYDE